MPTEVTDPEILKQFSGGGPPPANATTTPAPPTAGQSAAAPQPPPQPSPRPAAPPPASRGYDPLGDLARSHMQQAKEYGTGLAQGVGENVTSIPFPGRRFLGATLGRTEPGEAVDEFLNRPWSSETWPQIAGRATGLGLPYRGAIGPAAKGAFQTGKNVAAWELAHYLTGALGIPGGYHAAWAVYHTLLKFPGLGIFKTGVKGGEKAAEKEAVKAAPKAAKGASKAPPEAAEGTPKAPPVVRGEGGRWGKNPDYTSTAKPPPP